MEKKFRIGNVKPTVRHDSIVINSKNENLVESYTPYFVKGKIFKYNCTDKFIEI